MKWLEFISQKHYFLWPIVWLFIIIIVSQTDPHDYTNTGGNQISILQKYFRICEIEYSSSVQRSAFQSIQYASVQGVQCSLAAINIPIHIDYIIDKEINRNRFNDLIHAWRCQE